MKKSVYARFPWSKKIPSLRKENSEKYKIVYFHEIFYFDLETILKQKQRIEFKTLNFTQNLI